MANASTVSTEGVKARVGNPALVGTRLLTTAGGMALAAIGGSYWAVHAANRGDFITQGM